MQWTTHRLYRTLRIFSTISALWFVSLLAIFPLAAESRAETGYAQDLQDIQNVLEIINQRIANINNPLGPPVAQNQFDGRMDFLFQLLGYNQSVSPDRNILVLLEQIATNRPAGVNSAAQDILAGNPWWATNSAFALVRSKYSTVFPDDGKNISGLYSFPQFLSKWSSFLSYPISGTTSDANTVAQNWYKYFGHVSDRTGRPLAFDDANPYTWFHFMADAMRSNWVTSSSFVKYTEVDPSQLDMLHYYQQDNTRDEDTGQEPTLEELEIDVNTLDGNPFETLQTDLNTILPTVSGQGSANLVVIPEMTIGGIHVPIGQGDFLASTRDSSSIVNFVSVFCSWAWRLLTICGLFLIVRTEFGYWSTLGGSASD